MEHFRLRKYRGADTWRRVREAYVAGESGPSLARRYDVGLANLRKKASREGWTRSAVAAALDRELPPEPEAGLEAGTGAEAGADEAPDATTVRRRALARADALLAAGRAAEALTQLKAAEALSRLGAEEAEFNRMETWEEDTEAVRIKVGRIVEDSARELVEAMLAEGVRRGCAGAATPCTGGRRCTGPRRPRPTGARPRPRAGPTATGTRRGGCANGSRESSWSEA